MAKKIKKPVFHDNEYAVFYEDHKGNPHKKNVKAPSVYEAVNKVKSKNSSYKNVTARLIKKQTPSIKSIFH